jgi:flagellum-specific peptidoglycan hydrolase FlgJ
VTFKSLGQGAATSLVAALDPKLAPASKDGDGVYLQDCHIAETARWATDPVAAEKLWSVSEELVGEKFISK